MTAAGRHCCFIFCSFTLGAGGGGGVRYENCVPRLFFENVSEPSFHFSLDFVVSG